MSFDENALAWGSADFWTVDSEPVFVIGGGGAATDAVDDVSHLVWNIRAAALLSDGRVAMFSPGGERKVLIFEPSAELSVAFACKGDGPGEFRSPQHFRVLPGDTIVVWDYMFGPIGYFDPSGTLLRQWRIEFGPLSEAIGTGNQRAGESVRLPLPDGSFLIDARLRDGEVPREGYFRPPIAYMRVDSDYAAYSFGWWEDLEQFRIYPPAGRLGVIRAARTPPGRPSAQRRRRSTGRGGGATHRSGPPGDRRAG